MHPSLFLPHGITVDHEGNVWITDTAMHQVCFVSLPIQAIYCHSVSHGDKPKLECTSTKFLPRYIRYVAQNLLHMTLLVFFNSEFDSSDGVFSQSTHAIILHVLFTRRLYDMTVKQNSTSIFSGALAQSATIIKNCHTQVVWMFLTGIVMWSNRPSAQLRMMQKMTFGFHRRSACSTLKNVVSFNLIAVSQEYFMGCLTYECNEKACPHRRWEQLICGRVTSNHDRETQSSNVRPPLIRHGTRPGDSEPSSVIKVLGPNVLFIPNFATHLSLSSLDSVSV